MRDFCTNSYSLFGTKMSQICYVTFLACIVQGAFSQAIYGNGLINNGLGYNNLATSSLAANNIANGWPNTIANNLGGYPLAGNAIAATANAANNLGVELASNGVPLSGISSGGIPLPLAEVTPIGVGDVAVAGEMPVAGSTAVSGNVPVIGFVTFEGYLPAGGMVSVASNAACNGEVPV